MEQLTLDFSPELLPANPVVVLATPDFGRRWGRFAFPDRPKVIRERTVITARPIYMHRVEETLCFVPRITRTPEKFIRAAGSPALGRHSYLFAGQIVACDYFQYRYRESKTTHWRSDVIVDCGIPLNCSFGSEWDWMHTVVQFDPRKSEPGGSLRG
jgi:hypothetical protein